MWLHWVCVVSRCACICVFGFATVRWGCRCRCVRRGLLLCGGRCGALPLIVSQRKGVNKMIPSQITCPSCRKSKLNRYASGLACPSCGAMLTVDPVQPNRARIWADRLLSFVLGTNKKRKKGGNQKNSPGHNTKKHWGKPILALGFGILIGVSATTLVMISIQPVERNYVTKTYQIDETHQLQPVGHQGKDTIYIIKALPEYEYFEER